MYFLDSTYNQNHMVFVFFSDLLHLYPLSLSMLLQMAFFSFQLFTIEYDVSLYGLYYVGVCSLYTHLLTFVKCFFSVYWNDHMIFFLLFMNVVNQVDWPSLHPWDKSHLIMVYLMYFYIWFVNILLRIFSSTLIIDTDLQFPLCCLCLVLVSGYCWPHKWVRKCSFLFYFL